MFVADKVRQGSEGLVGIRQPFDPDYAIFDPLSQTSKSGYYIDDVSMFKASFFVDAVCPANANQQQVNELFQRLVTDSVVNVANNVFIGTDFVDRQVQYAYANTFQVLENQLPNGFVGQRFIPSRMKDVAFSLNTVYLQFEGDGDLELLLFNSNEIEPIQRKTITISPSKKTYKLPLDWLCDNTEYYKGEWYVGYIFDGSIVPYRKQFENANVRNQIKELYYEEVIVSGHMTDTLFDLAQVGQSGNIASGLNFDVTVYEDKTDFILQNLRLFGRAVQLSMAIKVFNEIITSDRSNEKQRRAAESAKTLMVTLKGLKGQGIREEGLEVALVKEIEQLRKQVERMQKSFWGKGQILVNTLS